MLISKQLDLSLIKDEIILNLIKYLDWNGSWSDKEIVDKNCLMYYDYCGCDDGYLCEHRLQFIIDYINESFVERK